MRLVILSLFLTAKQPVLELMKEFPGYFVIFALLIIGIAWITVWFVSHLTGGKKNGRKK